MATHPDSARRRSRYGTPKAIAMLVVCLLLTDLLLATIWGKVRLFPFSKTTPEYFSWLGTILSFLAGYVFWPLSIAVTILQAFLTRRRLGKLDSESFVGPIFNWAAEALDKLAVAMTALAVECLLLVVLSWGLVSASRPPAPPRPGQVVISADPRSEAYFRAIGSGIAIYMRGLPGNTLSEPVQYLQLPDVVAPQTAGPDWRGIESIAVSFDETRIYAVDSANGLVHFITNQAPRLHEVEKAYVGKSAKSIALSADERKLYAAVVEPIPLGKVHVFDTRTRKEIASIENVGCPEDIFAASTEPLLFVVTQCGLRNDPLYVIDTRTDMVIKAIPGFAVSNIVLATHDGKTIYVPTDDGLKFVRDYLSEKPSYDRG